MNNNEVPPGSADVRSRVRPCSRCSAFMPLWHARDVCERCRPTIHFPDPTLTAKERIALEQSDRRRAVWKATQNLARSACALLINSVECAKVTATWLYWEARH